MNFSNFLKSVLLSVSEIISSLFIINFYQRLKLFESTFISIMYQNSREYTICYDHNYPRISSNIHEITVLRQTKIQSKQGAVRASSRSSMSVRFGQAKENE